MPSRPARTASEAATTSPSSATRSSTTAPTSRSSASRPSRPARTGSSAATRSSGPARGSTWATRMAASRLCEGSSSTTWSATRSATACRSSTRIRDPTSRPSPASRAPPLSATTSSSRPTGAVPTATARTCCWTAFPRTAPAPATATRSMAISCFTTRGKACFRAAGGCRCTTTCSAMRRARRSTSGRTPASRPSRYSSITTRS